MIAFSRINRQMRDAEESKDRPPTVVYFTALRRPDKKKSRASRARELNNAIADLVCPLDRGTVMFVDIDEGWRKDVINALEQYGFEHMEGASPFVMNASRYKSDLLQNRFS